MFDADELRAFQEFAEPFFNTPIQIFRPLLAGEAWTSPTPPADYVPEYDFGDDEYVDPAIESDTTYPIAGGDGKLKAWFFSHLQQSVTDDSGQVATIDIHEIRLPIGTDLRPQDTVRSASSREDYVCVDTNAEDSYPDMLRAVLRRRE
jgi:hypothetical protein